MGKATAIKTDNERIAEWLGWEAPGEREEAPPLETISLEDVGDRAFKYNKPSGAYTPLPWFDIYILEWRKPGGLFAKIKERGLWAKFLGQLLGGMNAIVATEDDGSEWVEAQHVFGLLTIEPSQPTAASLKVIDGEEDNTTVMKPIKLYYPLSSCAMNGNLLYIEGECYGK